MKDQIRQAVAAADFGTASANKRGRTQRWPYVPIIKTTDPIGRDHTEQILAVAFETRDEAVSYAAGVIEFRRQELARKLAEPRYRALREQHGLPREI